MGCLYTEPAWREDINEAPELLSPIDDGDGLLLDFTTVSYPAAILVRERDGDQLLFDWSYPIDKEVEIVITPGDPEWSSSLTFLDPADPDLDGASIEVRVFDEARPANVIQVAWTIVNRTEEP